MFKHFLYEHAYEHEYFYAHEYEHEYAYEHACLNNFIITYYKNAGTDDKAFNYAE